jgi:hypothetical protein
MHILQIPQVSLYGTEIWENVRRYTEQISLITTARTDGYGVAYCLKTFAVTAGVGTQR